MPDSFLESRLWKSTAPCLRTGQTVGGIPHARRTAAFLVPPTG